MYPVYLIDSCRSAWATSFPHDFEYVVDRRALLLQIFPDSIVLLGYRLSYYGLSMLLLYALFGLHLYWGAYILRMAWKKFFDIPPPRTPDVAAAAAIRKSARVNNRKLTATT